MSPQLARAFEPAEKNVTGRLHHAVSVYAPFPMVGEDALSRVGLQHRGARLLHLEKQRVLIVGHQQDYGQRVPTLPTPTTLRAQSLNSKWSRSAHTDGRRLSR